MSGLPAAIINAYGQYRANKETRNFQTKMSNTAHQRQMRDLKAAGINPMLAGRLGGASTPSYQAGNIGAAAMQGYSQYSSAKQAQAQTEQAQAQTEQIKKQTEKTVEEVKILKERHAERWERLFAGMSSENVVASVQAVLNNVDVKKVLMQQDMNVTERYNLGLFLKGVREQSSHIRREASGVYAVINDAISGVGWFAPDKGNYVVKNPDTSKQWRYKSDKN